MCKFCDAVLGPGGFAHAESECPLKQGCYCPVCGPGTHFPIHCPHKPKRISRFAPAISSDKPLPITENTYIMADSNSGYVEYLKQYGLEIHRKHENNRDAVAHHLMSRNESFKLVMHKIPSAEVKPCEEVMCGLSHGENEVCMMRKVVKSRKNKMIKVETDA